MKIISICCWLIAVSWWSSANAIEKRPEFCPLYDGSVSRYLSTHVICPFRDRFDAGKLDPRIWLPTDSSSGALEDANGVVLSGRTKDGSALILTSRPIRVDRGCFSVTYEPCDTSRNVGYRVVLAAVDTPDQRGQTIIEIPLGVNRDDREQLLTVYFNRNASYVGVYENKHFKMESLSELPPAMELRLIARSETSDVEYCITLHGIDSDFRICRPAIPVVTTATVSPGTRPDEKILHYNMDNGAKFEWFVRRQTPEGFELYIFKSEGLGPDGLRHVYTVDPPVLLWKWPVHEGETWEENQELIIDDTQRVPTRSVVRIHDLDAAMILPGGSFGNVMELSVTYYSNLGVDVSTFHFSDGIGMIREEQLTNDGRTLLTEFVSATYFTPVPPPRIRLEKVHVQTPTTLEVLCEARSGIDGVILCASNPESGEIVFITGNGDVAQNPELIAIGNGLQDNGHLRFEIVPPPIFRGLTMIRWLAVTIKTTPVMQMSCPAEWIVSIGSGDPAPGVP